MVHYLLVTMSQSEKVYLPLYVKIEGWGGGYKAQV